MEVNDETVPEDPDRRDFLEKATGALAVAGVAVATWPFISSMNPSRDILANAETEVDLSGIAPGKCGPWNGRGNRYLYYIVPQSR